MRRVNRLWGRVLDICGSSVRRQVQILRSVDRIGAYAVGNHRWFINHHWRRHELY